VPRAIARTFQLVLSSSYVGGCSSSYKWFYNHSSRGYVQYTDFWIRRLLVLVFTMVTHVTLIYHPSCASVAYAGVETGSGVMSGNLGRVHTTHRLLRPDATAANAQFVGRLPPCHGAMTSMTGGRSPWGLPQLFKLVWMACIGSIFMTWGMGPM
jgi:hypothetical protein